MTSKTFIFMGQSASGKGTQARLLIEYLENKEKNPVLYIETGARFRNFITEQGHTNNLSNEIMKQGGRQPDFLAVWNWGSLLVDGMKENTHLVLDGVARSAEEAYMLDTALGFYDRSEVYVFFMNASADWVKQNALARGRIFDLTPGEAETKMKWFNEKVVPALEFFKTNSRYTYTEINAEQPIEKVHSDIMSVVQW